MLISPDRLSMKAAWAARSSDHESYKHSTPEAYWLSFLILRIGLTCLGPINTLLFVYLTGCSNTLIGTLNLFLPFQRVCNYCLLTEAWQRANTEKGLNQKHWFGDLFGNQPKWFLKEGRCGRI